MIENRKPNVNFPPHFVHATLGNKTISLVMGVKPSTQRDLAIFSGNICAFPGCVAPIYDTEHDGFVGEVCHIKAKSPGGPRYDPNQTDEERNGFDNQLLMCQPHHSIVDNPANLTVFTVEVLQEYKRNHESRFQNTIMTEDLISRLVMKILERLPQSAESSYSLEPLLEAWLNPPNVVGRLDWYDLRVRIHNGGESTVRDYQLQVEIPANHAKPSDGSVALLRDQGRGDVKRYRFGEDRPPFPAIFPGESSDILMMIDLMVPWDDYKNAPTESVVVKIYGRDKLVATKAFPIDELLRQDRKQYILKLES